MKVILISGKARNGKSETAKLLKSKLESQRYSVLISAYGDLVKFINEKYLGCDNQKNEVNRSNWQHIGDKVREQYPNYFIDFVIDMVSIFIGKWDYVIVPDCRFPNEVDAWRNIDGIDYITVRINRFNFESTLTEEQKNHPSETSLDNWNFDYYINADNNIESLEKEVRLFYKLLKDGEDNS
jgi:hypothetical protein